MLSVTKARIAPPVAMAVGMAIALSGCATANPMTSASDLKTTLVVGSQDYYSNVVVAEIYAQALEKGGFAVTRSFRIGQREVYLPELKAGKIDVFPEYIGSLDQALNKAAAGGSVADVVKDLAAVLPAGLRVLEPAKASDQNSWTVTAEFAKKYRLTDIASLSRVTEPIIVGGNSELQTRPYGPATLKSKYGISTAGFSAVEDGGGPLTVKALVDNKIQLANIYTADPNIVTNKLVALSDPDHLFLPDNLAPVVSKRANATVLAILNRVSAKLSQQDLVRLNSQSVNDQKSAAMIAKGWLAGNGLAK